VVEQEFRRDTAAVQAGAAQRAALDDGHRLALGRRDGRDIESGPRPDDEKVDFFHAEQRSLGVMNPRPGRVYA